MFFRDNIDIDLDIENEILENIDIDIEPKIDIVPCLRRTHWKLGRTIIHCKKKSSRLMDATNRAGIKWHPGNRPVVKFNGHDGSLVN